METAFRIVMIAIAILFSYLAWGRYEAHDFQQTLLFLGTALGALSASNVLDLSRRVSVMNVVRGQARWRITPIGAALDFLALSCFLFWLASHVL